MMSERKKPGPKPKHQTPRKEYHLKFVPELSDYIEQAATQGYQAFFDELVRCHMEETSKELKRER
jgi:hypothetical protein